MRKSRFLLVIFLVSSCRSILYTNTRLHKKEIKTADIKIDWFFYSDFNNITPDFLTIEYNVNVDTICVSDNIKDVSLIDSTVTVSFYGNPARKSKSIEFNKPKCCNLIIDTHSHKGVVPFRDFYK